MRIDKFLKSSRIIKRRTLAKEACDQGRIFVNDKAAKAGTEVSVGDKIKIVYENRELNIEVVLLLEHVLKDQAESMYKVI